MKQKEKKKKKKESKTETAGFALKEANLISYARFL